MSGAVPIWPVILSSCRGVCPHWPRAQKLVRQPTSPTGAALLFSSSCVGLRVSQCRAEGRVDIAPDGVPAWSPESEMFFVRGTRAAARSPAFRGLETPSPPSFPFLPVISNKPCLGSLPRCKSCANNLRPVPLSGRLWPSTSSFDRHSGAVRSA